MNKVPQIPAIASDVGIEGRRYPGGIHRGGILCPRDEGGSAFAG